jgi:hypothetical protein
MEFISREVIHSLWQCQHVDWSYLGSRVASRGILLMWNRWVVEKVEECVRSFVVLYSFKSVTGNFEWAFAGVWS